MSHREMSVVLDRGQTTFHKAVFNFPYFYVKNLPTGQVIYLKKNIHDFSGCIRERFAILYPL